MNEMSDFEGRLAAELEHLAGPRRAVDARAIRQAAAAPTGRLRRWWPLSPVTKDIPTTDQHVVVRTRRTRTMFTPIRVAAGTAVLALSGTLLLVASTVEPPARGPMPGAEANDVSMETTHYTGSISAWDAGSAEVEMLPDRTIERWPTAWYATMSDPRATGRGEAMDYLETITGAEGFSVVTHTGVGRLTTSTGSPLLGRGAYHRAPASVKTQPLARFNSAWRFQRSNFAA